MEKINPEKKSCPFCNSHFLGETLEGNPFCNNCLNIIDAQNLKDKERSCKMGRITDFLDKKPHVLKEFKEKRGEPGDIIAIYRIKTKELTIRDYFAKILEIKEEDGMFLHYLEKLPQLTHEEKLRRARR